VLAVGRCAARSAAARSLADENDVRAGSTRPRLPNAYLLLYRAHTRARNELL
jgi:hypothetical protein